MQPQTKKERHLHERRRCPSRWFQRRRGNSQARIALLILLVIASDGSGPDASDAATREAGDARNDLRSTTSASSDDDSQRYTGPLETENSLKERFEESNDAVEDSIFDPLQPDPDCIADPNMSEESCWSPPATTVEKKLMIEDEDTCTEGIDDLEINGPSQQQCLNRKHAVDQHWGNDPTLARMRQQLQELGSGASAKSENCDSCGKRNTRPPIFLLPGLASTRLVSWRFKGCPHPLLSDIKVQDYVWLNLNLIMQMSTINATCFQECLQLGWNQTDTDDHETGCKLRPDEGLDAISSLSPGGIGSQILVGGTNTVYAWLIQWLADNLGYDVSNIIGLPYDWRLSPDKMEERDGFLTLTRRRIEVAVQTSGEPGIMVAHSMGNLIFRYFLAWLRVQFQEEAHKLIVKQAELRAKAYQTQNSASRGGSSMLLSGWVGGVVTGLGLEDWLSTADRKEEEVDRHAKLSVLAKIEGDKLWREWIKTHVWTYVGLSAPLLGAVNPLRAVISGENMGMPVTDHQARTMELTFGSTHTVNPISTKAGFCDEWDAVRWDEEADVNAAQRHARSGLSCLDDIANEIQLNEEGKETPWKELAALETLLHHRHDWDSEFPMLRVIKEVCDAKDKSPCITNDSFPFGPRDAQTGNIFTKFSRIWKEEGDPLIIKREQLRESFWDTNVTNILNQTWDRPPIKHVIMAYGVDMPTEVGYVYRKQVDIDEKHNSSEFDTAPVLQTVIWETAGGQLAQEVAASQRTSIADILLLKKKPKRVPWKDGRQPRSGDGSVPYLSLSWAQTWLLHAARKSRHRSDQVGTNPLDDIEIYHRPKGGMDWIEGGPPHDERDEKKSGESSGDTGTTHPHGTKYKPLMVRYRNNGTSNATGSTYTTTVLEVLGIEHKETTRNYDTLAAVFTDVLKFMHEDFDIV